MNKYQNKINDCIIDKLETYARHESSSIYNLELLYRYYVKETRQMYRNPQEHLSKILVVAYNRVITEMEKV